MKLNLNASSRWGEFDLIPRQEWKITNTFIDLQSGLLVVNEQPADQSKLTPNEYGTIHVPNQRYIVDVKQRKILTAAEWTQLFDYQAQHKISPDGAYELITQRRHNPETEIDLIEEQLIELKTGRLLNTSKRVAFYDNSYGDLYERYLQGLERAKEAEEALAKSKSLEQHFFHYLKQLKERDVLLHYQNAEGKVYRLVYVEGYFKFQREEKKFFAGSEQIHYFSFNRFATPEEAWRFMTQDPAWFMRYQPIWYKQGERLSNPLFARHLIHVANQIRNTTQINWEHYVAIRQWGNILYAHDIAPSEYLQICPNCTKKVSFYPRYPTYICSDCSDLITDKSGRRLSFSNTSMSGGCQGYYLNTNEKYEGYDCYIGDKQFVAKEARFGGVVIELYDETRKGY
ncbi:MAG: hypothetical protein AAF927_29980 [Bacteroidota bacterium]